MAFDAHGEALPDEIISVQGVAANGRLTGGAEAAAPVYGGNGKDIMVGKAGSDIFYGNGGADRFNFSASRNLTGDDSYFGGTGTDTLALSLTADNWLDPAFQAELAALTASSPSQSFTFDTLNLTIQWIENVEVVVDGVTMTVADDAVTAEDDAALLLTSQGSVTGNVLDNDSAPDLVADLTVTDGPDYGSVTLAADGTYVFTVDASDPAVTALAPGEVLIDTFTYQVTDADGDTSTATVEVTIAGPAGFEVDFNGAQDSYGIAVSSCGDINGDGIDDFMIGAPTVDDIGAVYVIFGVDYGSGATFDTNIDLTTLDGTNGFILMGDPDDGNPGYSIAAAGDVNGDGIDDIIVGASAQREYAQGYDGTAYVIYGKDTATEGDFDAVVELAELDGTDGFAISGESNDDKLGYKVAAAGDVNGDGIDDIIVGGYGVDVNGMEQAGSAYVIFGKDTATEGDFAAVVEVETLDGTNGFAIPGTDAENQTGHSVAGIGDVNGDGIDDLLVGAYGTDVRDDTLSGEAYVIYGKDTETEGDFDAVIDLDALDGTNGFVLRGPDAGDSAGRCVAAIGDVNGDGIDDFYIAGFGYDPGTDKDGTVYIVFGRDTATEGEFAATFNLGVLNGENGFTITSANPEDLLGRTVSAVGDINGDGVDDFIVGAPDADPNGVAGAGEAYLIYGVDTATEGDFDAVFDLESLDGTNGYVFQGESLEQHAAYSVASAGDVNGDGITDLLIGVYGEEFVGSTTVYSTYVVFGGEENLALLDASDGTVDGVIQLANLTGDEFIF